jgi:hypothetical protein
MGWFKSFGAGTIASVLCAWAWGWVVSYYLGNRRGWTSDNTSLMVTVALILALPAGFLVGVVVSRFSGNSLWHAVALSAGPLCGLAALAAVVMAFTVVPPGRIDGKPLVMELEVMFEPGWTPDKVPDRKAARCGLDLDRRYPSVLDWEAARTELGRWVIPMRWPVRANSARQAVVLLGFGMRDCEFTVPTADPFSHQDLSWHPWTKAWGDTAQARYRVQFAGDAEAAKRAAAEAEARHRQKDAALDRLTAQDSLESWLDALEPDPDFPPFRAAPRAVEAVEAQMDAVPALLRSSDGGLVGRAAIALGRVRRIPAEVTPALVEAGHRLAGEIGEDTGDGKERRQKITYAYFEGWTQAVDHAADVDQAAYRALLNEMAAKVEHPAVKFDFNVRYVVRERIAALKSGKAGL